MVLYVPLLREMFRFSFLQGIDLLICLTAAVVSVSWFEALKLLRREPRRWPRSAPLPQHRMRIERPVTR